jgi:hypothetical protein
MGLIDGLKKAIATAGAQITSSSPKPQGIYFTTNFQHKAKQWGLSRPGKQTRNEDQKIQWL